MGGQFDQICQIFEPIWANFICHWANFQCCKWPNNEQMNGTRIVELQVAWAKTPN